MEVEAADVDTQQLAQLAAHFDGVRIDNDDTSYRCVYLDQSDRSRAPRRIKFVLRLRPGPTLDVVCITQLEIALVSEITLMLRLEPHGYDDAAPPAMDVQVNDNEFDQRYAVEGAPLDVVKALLTPETRHNLLAGHEATLRTLYGLYGGYLAYSEARSITDAAELITLVKRVDDWALEIAAITTRLANQRHMAMPVSGDPFRTAPDTSGDTAVKLQRRREVVALDEARDRQANAAAAAKTSPRFLVVLVALVAATVAAALAQLL